MAEVMESVIELCRTSVGGDTIFLILHDAGTDELVGVAQTGLPYNPDGHFRLSPTTRSMAVWAFRHGETAAIPDVLADPRTSPELRQRYQLRSALAVPLHLEGRVIGVLMTTSSSRQRDYSQQDMLLMEALAREVALAVHTQMLYQQRVAVQAARVEREERVRLLLDYTAEAIFGVDLEGHCTFVNPACLRMLGYEREAAPAAIAPAKCTGAPTAPASRSSTGRIPFTRMARSSAPW
jgi:GAF domain-containing protein